MTDAIEAGARADLLPCPFCGSEAEIERYGDHSRSTIYQCTSCSCFLETGEEWWHGRRWNERAAIASGALVPESAVAEMRERCAQAGWKAAYDSGQIRRHTDTPDEVANAIRQLDIVPASGDYVVVPKKALDWLFGEGPDDDGEWFGSPENDVKAMKYWWRPKLRSMLNAASRTGGEK